MTIARPDMTWKKRVCLMWYLCNMSPCQCNISSCFDYGMRYALQARWRSAGGFSLLPYVPIALAQLAPYTSTRAARTALYNMPKMGGLFLCNFFVDIWRMICYNQSDLWITYEEGKVDYELKIFNQISSGFQLPYFASYTLFK